MDATQPTLTPPWYGSVLVAWRQTLPNNVVITDQVIVLLVVLIDLIIFYEY